MVTEATIEDALVGPGVGSVVLMPLRYSFAACYRTDPQAPPQSSAAPSAAGGGSSRSVGDLFS
jgi:hypothetical protein